MVIRTVAVRRWTYATLGMLLFALLAVPASPAPNAAAGDREIASFIGDYLEREIAARDIPGGAIVVRRGGRTILRRGFGVRDYGSRRPVDPGRDLFPTGSTSKLATWFLVMQLVEEGRIDLDRDINAYLDFRIPVPPGRPVTMRHLMTHSAGFGDRLPMVSEATGKAPLGVKVRENRPPMVYAPGEAAAYSNYGAALAGYIVERMRGKPYAALVEQRVLGPLGMRNSTVRQPTPAALRARLVSTYGALARRPSPVQVTSLAPAGSIDATPDDIAHWVALLLGEPTPVLSAGSVRSMMTLQRPLVPGLTNGFGLGTVGGCYRRVCHFGHGGVTPSLATDLQVLPGQGLGWYVAFNGRGVNGSAVPLRQDLLRAVIDRFFADRTPPAVRPDLSTAAEVEGRYLAARRMHDGPMRLLDLGAIPLRAGPGGVLDGDLESGTARFLPVDRDRFVEARSGLPLAVARGTDGHIARIASPLFNIATDYEPAPRWQRFALVGLLAAPILLLLVALTAVSRWIRQRFFARPAAPPMFAGPIARPALAAAALVMAAWAAFLVLAIVEPRYSEPGFLGFKALRIASWLLSAAGISVLVDVVRCRNPRQGWWVSALIPSLGVALLALWATMAGFGFVAGLA